MQKTKKSYQVKNVENKQSRGEVTTIDYSIDLNLTKQTKTV